MERVQQGLDELVEHWTVLDDERDLIAGKRGPTRLGFALLLKFYTQHGRFPSGRSEFPDEAVDFVARQVKVAAPDIGFYLIPSQDLRRPRECCWGLMRVSAGQAAAA